MVTAPTVFLPSPTLLGPRRSDVLAGLSDQLREIRGTRTWPRSAVLGWPAEAIVEAAERRAATMIIIGIGRHRPIDRLLAHETAISVIRRAPLASRS